MLILIFALLTVSLLLAPYSYARWKQVTKHYTEVNVGTLRKKMRSEPKYEEENRFQSLTSHEYSASQIPNDANKAFTMKIDVYQPPLKYDDLVLVLFSDPFISGDALQKIDFGKIRPSAMVSKFRSNKISLVSLLESGVPVPTSFSEKIKEDIKNDEHNLTQRIRLMKSVSRLFRDSDIEHLFIKLYDKVRLAYLTDIDVLTKTSDDELIALYKLQEVGWHVYHLSADMNPLKLTAYDKEIVSGDAHGLLGIDFYPELAYLRFSLFDKKFAEKKDVFARRRNLEFDGFTLCAPSPEDDIIIVMTHDFDHRYAPLASVLNIIQIMKNDKIDWNYLMRTVSNEHLIVQFYTYTWLINRYTETFYHTKIIPTYVTNRMSKYWYCRIVNKILELRCKLSFPFDFPMSIVLLDLAFYELSTIDKR